jgi:hypothetical protein
MRLNYKQEQARVQKDETSINFTRTAYYTYFVEFNKMRFMQNILYSSFTDAASMLQFS